MTSCVDNARFAPWGATLLCKATSRGGGPSSMYSVYGIYFVRYHRIDRQGPAECKLSLVPLQRLDLSHRRGCGFAVPGRKAPGLAGSNVARLVCVCVCVCDPVDYLQEAPSESREPRPEGTILSTQMTAYDPRLTTSAGYWLLGVMGMPLVKLFVSEGRVGKALAQQAADKGRSLPGVST
jgi:hypothetical protein